MVADAPWEAKPGMDQALQARSSSPTGSPSDDARFSQFIRRRPSLSLYSHASRAAASASPGSNACARGRCCSTMSSGPVATWVLLVAMPLSIGAAHQHGTDGEGGHNGRIDRTFSTWAPIWAACQFCVTTMPALLRTIFLLICSVRDKLCERRSVGDIVNTLRSCEIGRRTGHKRTVRHESRRRKYAGSGDHGAAGDELGHRAGHEIAFPYSGLSG